MSRNQTSYRQILKTTSLFGGVEILRIIVYLIQTKVVAILLGSAGIGIQNLFYTMLNMFVSGFGMGLHTSSVREIAQAKASNDIITISKSILTLRRWVISIAIVGVVCMIVFSTQLSLWTFGSEKFGLHIKILSLALFFTLISNGQIALIKGLRKLKDLALISLFGSIISLFISIPLYYFYGIDSIVPVLVVTALTIFLCSWLFARKIKVKKVNLSIYETFVRGKLMAKLGFFLMLSTFLAQFASFIINVYISTEGSYNDVGFYRAGYLITSHYVGLIFSAMAADFLPRLSEVNENIGKMSQIVHNQSEVATLIITPMVCFLFPFATLLIKILYSSEFLVVEGFICWGALGLLSRTCVWCLSYVLLAKGLSLHYFYSELFANITNIIFCVVGYKLWNIEGFGIAFLLNNLVCLVYNYIIVRKKCFLSYNKDFFTFFFKMNLVVVFVFLLHVYWESNYTFVFSIAVAFIVSYKCLNNLRVKTGFSLKNFKKNKR